ncbi:hypothetical protein B7P43_G17851, partial [Cryptotermes secundus]
DSAKPPLTKEMRDIKDYCFSREKNHRLEVIDLTLGTNKIENVVSNWHVSDEPSLSDHRYICFKISNLTVDQTTYRNILFKHPVALHTINDINSVSSANNIFCVFDLASLHYMFRPQTAIIMCIILTSLSRSKE